MGDKSFLRNLRQQLTTGILVLLPVLITIILVGWLFNLLDGILGRYFARIFGEYIHGVGFVSLILLIWVVGAVSRTYIGGKLNELKDATLARIPFVGSIFGAVKQVSDGFLEMDSSNFEQVALLEYPRKGLYAVGFVTSRKMVPFDVKHEEGEGRFMHMFVPTVPNPTSGYLILVPSEEVYRLKMSVEDGLKLVLSLGMIHPDQYDLARLPSATAAKLTPVDLPRKQDSPGQSEQTKG